MSFLDNLQNLNPFAGFFKRARETDNKIHDQEIKNSQGVSQEEYDMRNLMDFEMLNVVDADVTTVGIQFDQYFVNKAGRIAKYRDMSRYPEVKDGLNQVCDEAIVDNPEGDIVTLDITEELPQHIEDEIRKYWRYLITDVFKFNERGWDLFKKWLIEAELYVELVLNNEGDNIIGIKILPAHTMIPLYEENKIVGYLQIGATSQYKGNVDYAKAGTYEQTGDGIIVFDKDQVAYVNFGDTGNNIYDVRGYLDSVIKSFNQLTSMEDALVVYRLVRAPERRVWNIYTGKMPKGKAEDYVKGLIQRYKKKFIYDTETGAVNASQNVQSLLEDYWFTKDIEGNGTTVDTIGGAMNLGELEDINYFLQKLYKTLMLPRSRWEDPANSTYSNGKSESITREEIKFSRFVERLQRRFKYVLLDSFITLLRLRGIEDRYINENFFNILFTKSNLFKEYKELELLEARLGILSNVNDFVYDKNENPKGYFAREFALRRFFLMTDNEWILNEEMLNKEKNQPAIEGQTPEGEGGEMGGGLGGEFGSDFGAEGGGMEAGGELTPEIGGTAETPAPEGEAGGAETTPAPTGPVTAPETVSFKNFYIKEEDKLFANWVDMDEEIIKKYQKK